MIRATVPGLFGVGLGAVGALLAVSGGSGGGVWGVFGGVRGGKIGVFGPFWVDFGPFWVEFGVIWVKFGVFWGGVPGGSKKGHFGGGGKKGVPPGRGPTQLVEKLHRIRPITLIISRGPGGQIWGILGGCFGGVLGGGAKPVFLAPIWAINARFWVILSPTTRRGPIF